MGALLQVRDLSVAFGPLRAVDGLSYDLNAGETLAIVGESGSGKSVSSMALLGLLPPRSARIEGGEARFDGKDLLRLSERDQRRIRGNRIAMIFQEPMTSLTPVLRIGQQLTEALVEHRGLSQRAARAKAQEMLRLVDLSDPPRRMRQFPHELSGGMRQRVVLAMALITDPELVILDEPTSALDVLTQASIMNVLKRIKRERGTSFMLITHDVATSSEIADRVALMYAGQLVEISTAGEFFRHPAHPYSKLLMASVPRLRQEQRPAHIPGQPPNLLAPPDGCRFADRCPSRFQRCAEDPKMFRLGYRRQVRCWLFAEGGKRP